MQDSPKAAAGIDVKTVPKRGAAPGRFSLTVLLALVGVSLLTVAVRAYSWRNYVNPAGGYFLPDSDTCTHLRRILLGVQSFPRIPAHDPYMSYPVGAGQVWSPFFDYAYSAVAWLFGLNETAIQTLAFWSNPCISLVTVVLLFFIVRRMTGSDWAGIAAAFIIALNPGHIGYNLASNFDHHGVELIFVALFIAVPLLERDGRLPAREKCLLILLLVVSILFWRGYTLFWSFLAASALVRGACRARQGDPSLSRDYALSFLAGALLISFICLVNPWGSAGGISFNMISWFQPLVLAILAAGMVLVGTARSLRAMLMRCGIICGILLLAAAAPPFLKLYREVWAGMATIFGGDPFFDSVTEIRSLYADGLLEAVLYATLLWLLLPLLLFFMFREFRRGGRGAENAANLMVWGILSYSMFHLRYLPFLGLVTACSFGWACGRLESRETRPVTGPAFLLVVALLLLPSWKYYREALQMDMSPFMKAAVFGDDGVLKWLRDRTPPTTHFLEANSREVPEYGVLSPWAIGTQIVYYGRRPSISTNFGWESYGLYEVCAFMATDDPVAATKLLRDNRIRYVITLPLDTYYRDTVKMANFAVAKGKLPAGLSVTERIQFSTYYRLMYHDGSAYVADSVSVPAFARLRLRYETPAASRVGGKTISWVKVFETVPGARLVGTCRPDTLVTLRLPLKTNRDREFFYSDVVRADRDGNFAFTVPYPTGTEEGGVTATGRYAIGCGEGGGEISLSKGEIEGGAVRNLGRLQN